MSPLKFASVTRRLTLREPLALTENFQPEPGTVVAVEILGTNPQYPELELPDGHKSTLAAGDIVVGALGSRQPLRGFVGRCPERVAPGMSLHLLNMGGVIGVGEGGHPKVGEAIPVRLKGAVLSGGKIVHLRDAALPAVHPPVELRPLILVAGSCMQVGKTSACVEIVRHLTQAGLRVGGAKASGVASQRDLLRMQEAGAIRIASFVDCGVPSSVDATDPAQIAWTLASHVGVDADAVVLELGDGILGHYGVEEVLDDREFMRRVTAVVYAASDLVSAWGGIELLSRRGVSIAVITGPATDTVAGIDYIERTLGVPAANAALHGEKLARLLLPKLTVPA